MWCQNITIHSKWHTGKCDTKVKSLAYFNTTMKKQSWELNSGHRVLVCYCAALYTIAEFQDSQNVKAPRIPDEHQCHRAMEAPQRQETWSRGEGCPPWPFQTGQEDRKETSINSGGDPQSSLSTGHRDKPGNISTRNTDFCYQSEGFMGVGTTERRIFIHDLQPTNI